MDDVMRMHTALRNTGLPFAAISWGGFNLFGDNKSISEVSRLISEAGKVEVLRRDLAELRNTLSRRDS